MDAIREAAAKPARLYATPARLAVGEPTEEVEASSPVSPQRRPEWSDGADDGDVEDSEGVVKVKKGKLKGEGSKSRRGGRGGSKGRGVEDRRIRRSASVNQEGELLCVSPSHQTWHLMLRQLWLPNPRP